MKGSLSCIFALTILGASVSCYYPEPLPRAVTSKFDKGRRLDEVWISPLCPSNTSFNVRIKWIGKPPKEEYINLITDAANKINSKTSDYALDLFCSVSSSPALIGPFSDSGFFVEGLVTDKKGVNVAAFRNNRLVVISTKETIKNAILDTFDYISNEFNRKTPSDLAK